MDEINQALQSKSSYNGESKGEMIASFKKVIADGETLLRAAADYSAEGLLTAKQHLQSSIEQAKVQLTQAKQKINEGTSTATTEVEIYVIKNPWKSLAIAGSIGLVAGLFLRRRN